MTIHDDLAASTEQLATGEKPTWRWTPVIATFSIITMAAALINLICFALGFASPLINPDPSSPAAFDANQVLLAPLLAIVVIITAPIAGMRGGKGRLVGLICGLVTLLLPALAILRVSTAQVGY